MLKSPALEGKGKKCHGFIQIAAKNQLHFKSTETLSKFLLPVPPRSYKLMCVPCYRYGYDKHIIRNLALFGVKTGPP